MKASILAPLLASLAMAQKVLDDQFAYHSSDGYYLNNNEWGRDSGKGRQCTYIDRIDKVGVGWHTEWSWSGEPGSVKSYPYSGRELAKKRTVNSIKSIHSKAEWMYRGTDVHANVAYDLFTAKDPDRDTSSGDYELMIWYALACFSVTKTVALTRCSNTTGSETLAACIPSGPLAGTSTWPDTSGSYSSV